MLNFDLSETKAGEELIDIGRQEGRREGHQEGRQELLYTQLLNRFGNRLPVKKENLFAIDDIAINRLTNAIFDFKTVDDFVLWWSGNAAGAIKSH